nr:hypothetical protein [Kibdelosporangium sp. MJ126-NF4]CEL19199.1 hypothetical protein [Kibdelosporangium sp. MJ126-NF4]CTQ95001.1 hypothetical protein [Kibdelosporangium sp. MJ126-NF4]
MKSPYGTHPQALRDLLDAVGPAEVRVFTLAEDEEYGNASINRFPIDKNWSGARDFSGVRVFEQVVEEDYEDAAVRLGETVLRYASPESEVVVFWGNVVIPTIGISAALAAANAETLMDTGDDVWIYPPGRNVLIEYWHSGRITAGEIPA